MIREQINSMGNSDFSAVSLSTDAAGVYLFTQKDELSVPQCHIADE